MKGGSIFALGLLFSSKSYLCFNKIVFPSFYGTIILNLFEYLFKVLILLNIILFIDNVIELFEVNTFDTSGQKFDIK